MQHCLVITDQFNIGPTGTVVANLVEGLAANGCNASVVAFKINPNQNHLNHVLLKQDKRFSNSSYSAQIYKLRMILFKSYLDRKFLRSDCSAITKQISTDNKSTHFNFIMVICSGDANIRFLRLASCIAHTFKIPLVVHATDPIPSPEAWGEKRVYRKAVLAAIKPFYKSADLVSASNPLMLNYQLKALGMEYKENIVMYNPIESWNSLDSQKLVKNTFLYLGSLYGKRNPKVLINSFLKLLEKVPDARLLFLGTAINLADYAIPKAYEKHFVVIGYTDNVDHYIAEAEVLIDYNANIINDVFISSKLSKYLSYNRKIIMLCAENSAPDLFIAQSSDLGVWKCLFSRDEFSQIAQEALRVEQFDWTTRVTFSSNLKAKYETLKIIEKLKEI